MTSRTNQSLSGRNRRGQVGFSQRVRMEWLEQAVHLVRAGNDRTAVKGALQGLLQDKVSVGGDSKGCNRDKTINILMKVWVNPPKELLPLRDEGLALLDHACSLTDLHPLSMALNWGMVTAVYPFWSGVATQTGRLLRLQGLAAAAQIQRRVREQYGERETVSRAARRVLRSYLDWGVLQSTGAKGIYSAGATFAIDDPRLIAWMVEACLHARANGSASLKDLIDSPSFFPFQFKAVHAEGLVAASSRLDRLRIGMDDDLIMLRQQATKVVVPE